MSAILKDPSSQKILGAVSIAVLLWSSTKADRGEATRKLDGKTINKKRSQKGGNVDPIFWKRIRRLLTVVVPEWNCKETKYLLLLTLMLALRT